MIYVSELDRDGDGRVSFKDFDFAMKYDVSDDLWFTAAALCLWDWQQQHCGIDVITTSDVPVSDDRTLIVQVSN